MKRTTKIWLGVGAAVVTGAGAIGMPAIVKAQSGLSVRHTGHGDRLVDARIILAQHSPGGEMGELGEKGAVTLPPDLAFALRIAQIRGHLLVGDELVKLGDWKSALPHFLHPTEELYGTIRANLKDYKVAPFDAALKALAGVVKAKKSADYDKAFKAVADALASADEGLKAKQTNWDGFTVETAMELAKSATGEYGEAIVKGRIAKPVEYQDARGFVWQAERMIESVAAALEKKDAEALAGVRAGFAELKKAWPSPLPPKTPVKDVPSVLSDVSRIELAAGKLM